ncbi:hypothetical protein Scep_022462 [Stephania cephalantha]|uniref:Uncharacterized protein n=1 Tax=Stephania cephalantha TaxID=152367 RepID=A0AAP0FAH4_9MAGN
MSSGRTVDPYLENPSEHVSAPTPVALEAWLLFRGIEHSQDLVVIGSTLYDCKRAVVKTIEETLSNDFQVLVMCMAMMLNQREKELATKDAFLEDERKQNKSLQLEMLTLKTSHQAELKSCIETYKKLKEWLSDAEKYMVDNGEKPFLAGWNHVITNLRPKYNICTEDGIEPNEKMMRELEE